MLLNLEKQFRFYGSYHHNPVNVVIHIICVPVIMLCMLLLGTLAQPLFPVPEAVAIESFPPNLATVAGVVYTILYILMEPVAGALLAPLLLAGTAFVNHLSSTHGNTAIYWSLAVQAVAWIAQFVGHGVFEGRAPALLDNLVQAFFLAPFFVWLEVLFSLGYRPALKARIDKAVEVEVARFNISKKGLSPKAPQK
ncbi:uncharacterized protein CIMG_04308 [Coccidioides immitis RS]|uniref:DUF962 domain-containing protein n=3 Tax=Coccidioides immitis TaxID=5501 RepID=J3KD82_COCIM|nr:uncharacterized protein CIMG_04308 [Coccidioides immitis RS]EAS33284.3 hypothetical protein CIMG_04308 [Coccidioides immitis RS]KMP04441.1 hypothetical protein CIRG_04123 [Coccidioides immitis RMSCC 2394]KMU89961.1 hypothetical protein CIHG_07644 [Coccidioides immitis H538.4]TPX21046.1 hypothetical protein DIZ76_014999 [Coccidioides immitis]